MSDFRLIEIEEAGGGWAAWFSGHRELAVEGETKGSATRLLCESYGIECQECPDCGGSGRYVGLNVSEECRHCNGCGVA